MRSLVLVLVTVAACGTTTPPTIEEPPMQDNEGNLWGLTLNTPALGPSASSGPIFVQVDLPVNEPGGFTVSVFPPLPPDGDDLFVAVLVDYGQAGNAISFATYTRRPISFNVPGSYVKVRCILVSNVSAGTQYAVSAMATPGQRVGLPELSWQQMQPGIGAGTDVDFFLDTSSSLTVFARRLNVQPFPAVPYRVAFYDRDPIVPGAVELSRAEDPGGGRLHLIVPELAMVFRLTNQGAVVADFSFELEVDL